MPTLYPFQWGKKALSSKEEPIENTEDSSEHDPLEKLVNSTVNKYYPRLLKPVHACLAVFATLSLKGRTKPLSLIFEAASGLGKTAVLQMMFPAKNDKGQTSNLSLYVYRSDKFTPKSFVSHAANVKKTQLKDVDLLPRIEKKVLLTKELAPIFRGREQDLKENFSILISVLDGKGFTSDSGTMGQRGYQRPIIFNWLGATTPLDVKVHRTMSQLGTRFLFYEVEYVAPTEADLFAYAEKDTASKAEVECNLAVNQFLVNFFGLNPIGSVEPDSIFIPSELSKQIVRWAMFLVKGRTEVRYDFDDDSCNPVSAGTPEGPHKVIDYFKELARGHALIHGRTEVNPSDLELISHVAISSIPIHLRPIVRELRKCLYVDSRRTANLCKVSAPTARKYLKELDVLGIAGLTKGSVEKNESDKVKLLGEFDWMKIK